MSLLKEIIEKRSELEILERQYLEETPPCCNKKCGFWREKQTGNCSWSVLLEDCRDYKYEFENADSEDGSSE
ncbi:hypothetical protein [Flavobacterium gawalongense]|uniref:Uncharacterized protein n=1 Tax=Flavobacterium gawalongense TaxID=2594432 RepID=A0A553BQQ8_9FLAO|nr:hypothetical protein [Flavobacterium gawalongense]TRX10557.1 hypothetical protein FNW11_07490 [Flavobacterium gawalongense]TRX11689.1 hypothetical protein FNW10_06090 [Flavobacterium gawalongense]TRX29481.1 hypothetical protein FNW38_06185 [Flavobacterium gawalongense]